MYAHPKNACGEIAKPPEGYDDFGGWIVLIKRGDCNFDDKIRAAQNANFSAAIVHNVNSSVLGMYSRDFCCYCAKYGTLEY